MSAALGLVHGAAFSILHVDSNQAAWELLFGLVHWAIVGMALGTLPLMHSHIRYGGPRLVAGAGGDPSSEELLDPPGFYELGYPVMTVSGFLMVHLVFGVIVGASYGAWAGWRHYGGSQIENVTDEVK